MTDEKRAALAFICGSKYMESMVTRLYDDNRIKYIPYNIQRNQYGFNMFDYDRRSYLNGNDNQIFDFITDSYIQVVYNGYSFSGVDYQSNNAFNGTVSGNKISIYDYEHKSYFNYIIS